MFAAKSRAGDAGSGGPRANDVIDAELDRWRMRKASAEANLKRANRFAGQAQ